MKLAQSDSLANLRLSIENSLKARNGLVDELDVMINLISKSVPALVVYCVWFVLLFGLECFILVSKRHEIPTDYDEMINHQMNTHVKKLNILSGVEK